MNVLVIYWGKSGGLPKFTYEMADSFVRAGHSVYTVLSEGIYNRTVWEENKKIINTFIYTGDTKRFLYASVKMLFSSKKRILANLGDMVFDISICTMPYPWCRYISNLLNVERRYVICHDPIAHSGTGVFKRLIVEKNTYGYDDCIVMTKSFIPIVKQKYKYSEENIHFMRHGYYGYELPVNYTNAKRNDEKINFLFFGSINKYKGIGVLLEAYKDISLRSKNATLTIAGKGDLTEYSEQFKTLKVDIINRFIEDSEIASLFSAPNRVLVLPYIDATQSGVALIAMEFGVPIIASNTGGLKEQLFDGEVGTFFEPGNHQELAERMYEYILDDSMIYRQRFMIKKYADQLKWDTIVTDFIKE